MDFEKYSKQQFESLGLNSLAARKLADDLEVDANQELHAALLPAFTNIIERLNAQGHNLTMYDPIKPGDVSFPDKPTDGDCYLRLGYYVVVSAGYAHTTMTEEIDAAIAEPCR